jgi:hypothetical protein
MKTASIQELKQELQGVAPVNCWSFACGLQGSRKTTKNCLLIFYLNRMTRKLISTALK